MTSSTADRWAVHLRAGTDHVVARPGARAPGAVRAEPRGPLWIEVRGLDPAETVTVSIGSEELEFIAPEDGVVRWSPSHLLGATAGIVPVVVTRPNGDDLALALEVKPSKLAERSLRALLDDLEDLAPGLSSDLGGAGLVVTERRASPEALLQVMEEATGVVAESTAQIRMHQLHRLRERVSAVPRSSSRTTARDVRWLCQHPAAELRATATGRDAAVHREASRDLDVAENRGAVGVLGHLQALLDDMGEILEVDRRRLEAGRAVREAFRTDRGNLFQERDVPRLRAISARRRRVRELAGEIARARLRTGLPPYLPSGRLHRSTRVESHPGYWGLYRVAQQIQDVQAPAAKPVLAPVSNLDELYETWCAIQLASALASWAGTSIGRILRLQEAGWFVRLPRGEIARVQSGECEIRLLYEPQYSWGGDGPLVKLHPGRPWAPDLVIEERAGGHPISLHIFDAKHRVDPTRPDLLPLDAVREVWFKYTDSIGFRTSQLPAVASTWVLFPGRSASVHLNSPQMLTPEWPVERAQGGAVSLVPGGHEAVTELSRLLSVLLGPARV